MSRPVQAAAGCERCSRSVHSAWTAASGASPFPHAHQHGYRVLAVDNRGCGRSETPRRPWTIRTMADDAISVLDDAGVRRAHVCGPSLGGMVAQELAIGRPERVAALVIAACPPGLPRIDLIPYSAAVRTLQAAVRARSRRHKSEEDLRRVVRQLVSVDAARRTLPGSQLWVLVRDLMTAPAPTRGRLGQLAAAATHVGWRRLGRIAAPTQVQHGGADPIVPARAALALARRIPNSQLVLYDGAGHALILERPEEVARAALGFLARHDSLATAD